MSGWNRSRVLWLWLLVLVLGTGLNLVFGTVRTDLSQFLPEAVTPEEEVLLGQVREGAAARLILIGIRGANARVLAETSRRLERALSASGHFTRVENGIVRSGPAADERLLRYRYLLGPEAQCLDDLSGDGLRRALEARLAELRAPLPPPDKHLLAADPTACFRAMLLHWKPASSPQRAQGVWFSGDRKRALLVAETRAPASDLEGQGEAVTAIRVAFADIATAPGLEIDLSGPGFFSVGSRDVIKAETTRLSVAASLFVALILFAAFRSPRLLLLGALPLASGVLAGVSLVNLLFGYVHGITLAMGVTLLGVAVDYPLHVFSHARRDDAATGALASIWPTLLLGVATTALGYLALALTEFQGLAQLGVLAAAGLVTAGLCSRFLLPRLVRIEAGGGGWWVSRGDRVLQRGVSRRGLALAALGALVLLGLLAERGIPWETNLSRLSTVPAADIELDRRMRAELGAPDVTRLFYYWAPSAEQALRIGEEQLAGMRALVDSGAIRDFEMASLLVPSEKAQAERRAGLPLASALEVSLDEALAGLPFRQGAFAPYVRDVALSRELEPLSFADLRDGPLGPRVAALLSPQGGRWLALVPLVGVDDEALSRAIGEAGEGAGMRLLDLRAASAALIGRFVDETLVKVGLAALVIAAALAVGLRDRGRFLRVTLPILLAIQLDLGALILFQNGINLFHLVSLLLVLGLSIDYGLFFSRRPDSAGERAATFVALSLCALTSFAMFAMLALSRVPVLHAIGSTAAIGIAFAFPLAWLLARPPRGPAVP